MIAAIAVTVVIAVIVVIVAAEERTALEVGVLGFVDVGVEIESHYPSLLKILET